MPRITTNDRKLRVKVKKKDTDSKISGKKEKKKAETIDGNRKYHTENGRTLDALGGHTSTIERVSIKRQ